MSCDELLSAPPFFQACMPSQVMYSNAYLCSHYTAIQLPRPRMQRYQHFGAVVSDIQFPLHSSHSSYWPSVRLGSRTLFAGNKCYQRYEFHALQTPCPPLLARVIVLPVFVITAWSILLNGSHTIMLYHNIHPTNTEHTCHHFYVNTTLPPTLILAFSPTISLTIPLLSHYTSAHSQQTTLTRVPWTSVPRSRCPYP